MSPQPASGAPPTEERKAEERKARTRAALVRAGREVFAERGPSDATIADITTRAELGFGTFYLYFQSKEELLAAIVSEGMAEIARTLDRAAADAPDLRARQRAVILAYLRFAHDNGDLLRVIIQAAPSWEHLVSGVQQPFLDRIEAFVREGMAAGVVREGNAELMANMVLACVRLSGLWWTGHDAPSPEEVAEEVSRFVERGLAP